MQERYIPTAEEIAVAQDTMTPKQAELSNKREHVTGMLMQLGVEGFLSTAAHTGTGEHIAMGYHDTSYRYINGAINGHKILLYSSNEDPSVTNEWNAVIEGRIDGNLMSDEDGRTTWKKYAILGCTITEEEIHDAIKEIRDWTPLDAENTTAHNALKDIL